jgi:hypothetical protein
MLMLSPLLGHSSVFSAPARNNFPSFANKTHPQPLQGGESESASLEFYTFLKERTYKFR